MLDDVIAGVTHADHVADCVATPGPLTANSGTTFSNNFGGSAALALKRDAERAKKLALRENKELAKEVTQWVETAQGKFRENGGYETQCAQQSFCTSA